ncbi:ABC transporter ATP-binding protein, partial [Thermodesulfobacteriota bacterium]
MWSDFGYSEEKKLGKPYDVKMLKRLYPFSRPYKRLLLCSILLVMLITLLDLSLPYVTKIAIDRYIVPAQFTVDETAAGVSGDKTRYLRANITDKAIHGIVKKYKTKFIIKGSYARIPFDELSTLEKKDLYVLRQDDLAGAGLVAAVFLLVVLLNFGLNFLQVMIMEYTGQMIMHDLRVRLFNHIQTLSIAFFTRNPVGRLVTRVTNDVQNMHELFTSVIVFVFKDLFLLLGITIVLLSINWKLALISFAVLPFVIYASIAFSGHAREAFRMLRIKVAEINTKVSETLGGLTVIQLFGQTKENYLNFKKLNHENYLAGMRQVQIVAVFLPVIEFLGMIALAIVVFFGGNSVLTGTISLGALVAFISYVKMFFRPIRDIAEKYNILQNAMASAERIFLVLDNQERLPQPVLETPIKPLVHDKIRDIRFNEVSFGYRDNETVLKRISFNIHAGEVLAVVGPTGSGKTSLIQLILRFYDPTSGQVLVNGQDIKKVEKSIFRSKMALVMQDPFLFSGSIRDNIIYDNGNISQKEMDAILMASNCKHLVDKLPDGLETILSEGGTSISSGERQLIS